MRIIIIRNSGKENKTYRKELPYPQSFKLSDFKVIGKRKYNYIEFKIKGKGTYTVFINGIRVCFKEKCFYLFLYNSNFAIDDGVVNIIDSEFPWDDKVYFDENNNKINGNYKPTRRSF